jgi:ubiquinone/menaquinone biosynthesis C-methylase UbiE
MKFPDSAIAHKYLDPIAINGRGIEIGGSAHNPFNISNTINLDYTASLDTIFKQEEIKLCGEALPVDIVAYADEIPVEDNRFDFLINSHLFEHQPNPIKTLLEWHRVVRNDGIILSIIPHNDALLADKDREITTISHQVDDYWRSETCETHPIPEGHGKNGHYHTYTMNSYLLLISYINALNPKKYFDILEAVDPDGKVNNGFLVIMKVVK